MKKFNPEIVVQITNLLKYLPFLAVPIIAFGCGYLSKDKSNRNASGLGRDKNRLRDNVHDHEIRVDNRDIYRQPGKSDQLTKEWGAHGTEPYNPKRDGPIDDEWWLEEGQPVRVGDGEPLVLEDGRVAIHRHGGSQVFGAYEYEWE